MGTQKGTNVDMAEVCTLLSATLFTDGLNFFVVFLEVSLEVVLVSVTVSLVQVKHCKHFQLYMMKLMCHHMTTAITPEF